MVVETSDNSQVNNIQLFLNGSSVRTESMPPWDWSGPKGDGELTRMPAGEHWLEVHATTVSGQIVKERLKIIVNGDGASSALRVTGLSLINTANNTRYAAFDPIDDRDQVIINLDQLGTSRLSIVADTEGAIGSVVFGLNNNEDFRNDNGAPYGLTYSTGNFINPWNLDPGDYRVVATPYSAQEGGGTRGMGETILIRLEQAKLSLGQAKADLFARLNSGEAAQSSAAILNTGNTQGTFSIRAKPSWLSVSQSQGVVPAGGRVTLQLSAEACTQPIDETGELVLNLGSGNTEASLAVHWICSDRPLFDLALQRFYFNQAVPANDSSRGSEGEAIKLIINRSGLARAFVARNNGDVSIIPDVVLNYRTWDGQTGSYTLNRATTIPLTIEEGRASSSYNRLLPKEFYQPGTEFYVEVDPNNEVEEFLEDNNRYPASGYKPLNIVDVPTLQIVFVPVISGEGGRNPGLTDPECES